MTLLQRIASKMYLSQSPQKRNRKISQLSRSVRSVDSVRQEDKSYVSIDDFTRFIQNKKNNKLYRLLESAVNMEIEGAVAIRKRRYKHYKPENQMHVFAEKSTPMIYRARFKELISHHLSEMNVDIILVMIQYNATDEALYRFIKEHHERIHHNSNPMIKLTNVASIIHTFVDLNRYNILDIGSGNGKNIRMMQRAFNNRNISISGTDLPNWGPYNKQRKHNFPFRYIEINPYRIPWDDASFECITLFFVLHHVQNLQEMLRECSRVLKQNGTLVIIEHDVWDDYDHMLIDIQHNVYRHLYNESDAYSNYMNFYEWDVALMKENFKPTYTDKMKENIDYKHRFDLQFISVYKKI